MRNVDIHLVAKFRDGLEVKFVRIPYTANFFVAHLLFIVSGVYHVHTSSDIELHTLQEIQQSTTMFMTLKTVVKDYNDYIYFSYYGRLVTDT